MTGYCCPLSLASPLLTISPSSYNMLPGDTEQYTATAYMYDSSASSSGNGVATAYQWERVPELDSTTSTFYPKQTGTYNAQTDPTGCISGPTWRRRRSATKLAWRRAILLKATGANTLAWPLCHHSTLGR